MAEYSANFGGIDMSVGGLIRATGELNDELDALEIDVERSLAVWEGSARAAYHVQKRNWDLAALEMSRLLGESGITLRNVNETMFRVETQNTGVWG